MAYVAIADRDAPIHDPHTFFLKYIWSQDHKVIAIQYSIVAIFVGLVALVLSGLMRLQLGFPEQFHFVDPSHYYQFITMHGMIMVIYLLTALFLGGFGNYLIPLMCGARDMVFPYMNMLSFWVYFLAVLVLLVELLRARRPDGRRLDAVSAAGGPGRHAGLGPRHRPDARLARDLHHRLHDGRPELRDDRAPGALQGHDADADAAVGLGHLHGDDPGPARVSRAPRLGRDDDARRHARHELLHAGDQLDGRKPRHSGGSPLLFQHLFWFFGHPEVYIVALPAFGIVSDLLSTHARKNIFGYRMMVWAILAIGGLSFVVWAHHMYVSGMNPYFGFFFATTTLIIAVPTAIKVYNWVLTLWKGNIHLTVPMLFAIGFIFTFVHGGLTGPLPRQRDGGPAALRHVFRGRAFPHGHGRLADPRRVRRDLSLVSEDHRPDVERAARQAALLADVPRHVRDLPADALSRHPRRAAPLLRARRHRVPARFGAFDQCGDHGRGAHRRRSRSSSSCTT